MAGSFAHLFTKQAARYAEFRPSYPASLYDVVLKYAAFGAKPELAVDIATGSGQAAVELAKTFTKVLAIDSNVEQLKGAKAVDNIDYRQGLAEETGVPSAAADLITVAQALHWFDHPKFWKEAARILKPGGTLAAWGYGLCFVKDNPAATKLVLEFAYGDSMLGPYWSDRRRLIDEEYKSLEPDPALFTGLTHDKVTGVTTSTVEHFIGYLSSWSAYTTYRQKHPDREDPLIAFEADLVAVLPQGAEEFLVEWPIFVLLAKRK